MADGHAKPSLDAILTTPVHEGGADAWTRFEGASAAIGHYVRLVHEGRISPDDGWEAICQYNAAMLRPAWPIERLQAGGRPALGAGTSKKNGPPLLRNEAGDAAAAPSSHDSLQASASFSTTARPCRRTSSHRGS